MNLASAVHTLKHTVGGRVRDSDEGRLLRRHGQRTSAGKGKQNKALLAVQHSRVLEGEFTINQAAALVDEAFESSTALCRLTSRRPVARCFSVATGSLGVYSGLGSSTSRDEYARGRAPRGRRPTRQRSTFRVVRPTTTDDELARERADPLRRARTPSAAPTRVGPAGSPNGGDLPGARGRVLAPVSSFPSRRFEEGRPLDRSALLIPETTACPECRNRTEEEETHRRGVDEEARRRAVSCRAAPSARREDRPFAVWKRLYIALLVRWRRHSLAGPAPGLGLADARSKGSARPGIRAQTSRLRAAGDGTTCDALRCSFKSG